MKLRAIRLQHVGRFWPEARAIDGLADGLNVFAAENEVGKSTLFKAMRLALFTKYTRKAQDVKDLRSYNADEGPYIELDLAFGEKTYRLTKRYLTRPMARITDLATDQLIAQGDDAEDWLKQALGVSEKSDGPFGLLWVSQGDILQAPLSKSDATDKTQFLTALVEDEIEAVSDGGAAAAVHADAVRELSTMVTKARGDPTGEYKAAIAQVRDLEGRVGELSQQVQETQETRQALQRLTAELEDPDAEVKRAALQAAVLRAGETHQKALQFQQQVEHLTTTAKLAHEQFEAAEKTYASLKAAQDNVRSARRHRSDLANKLEEARQQKAVQQARLEKHAAAVQAAEADVLAGRQAVTEALAAEVAERAETDRKRLSKDLSDVEAAVVQIDRTQNALATLRIDAVALQRLETLTALHQQAEAERRAALTEVVVTYNDGVADRFQFDGKSLSDGDRLSVDGQLDIEVAAIGGLSVIAGRGAKSGELTRNASVAAENAAQALASVNCRSIEEAREQLRLKTRVMSELEAAQSITQRLAPDGIAALREKFTALEASVAASDIKAGGDVGAARHTLLQAEAAQQEKRLALEAVATELGDSKIAIARQEEQLAALKQTVDAAAEALGPEETWQPRLDTSAAAVTAAKSKSDTAEAALKAVVQSPQDVGAAGAALKAAQATLQAFDHRRSEARVEQSKHQGALERDQKSGVAERLAEGKELLAACQQKQEALARHVRAMKLLVSTLEEAQQATRDAFLAPVMQELKPLLDRVLPGAAVELDETFSPSGLVREGINEDFLRLSGGTREQIAILTRLAFAKLLAKKGRPVPVVLDDALVFSDDNRIARMFKVLEDVAQEVQIVFLTCRLATFGKLNAKVLRLATHKSPVDAD